MRRRLEEAELLYSHAITVLPTHFMYSNRAMVRLKVPLPPPSAPRPDFSLAVAAARVSPPVLAAAVLFARAHWQLI